METLTSDSNLSPTPAPPGRTVLCPGCGYDLRASPGDRCSECGLVLDRAALDRSGFPWAHRAGLGRWRAFLRTVWVVTIDAASLRQEAAKAQSPADGTSFRRWVATVVAACFAAFTAMVIRAGGLSDMVVNPDQYAGRAGLPPWSQDLLVPWSAGIGITPALFAYTTLLACHLVGVPRSIFRTRGMPEHYRQTVEAISGYVVAPLVLLLPATACLAAVFLLQNRVWVRETLPALPQTLIVGGWVLAFAAVAGTVHRTGQWRARTAHAGYPTGFAGMAELLVRWALGAVATLGVIPWCVGFVWMVIDSFCR